MSYTLNEYIIRVNQILNYPSVAYQDIAVFLDQAIAELNTSLNISLPFVSNIVNNYTENVKLEPVVVLSSPPDSTTVIPVDDTNSNYYYDTTVKKYIVKRYPEGTYFDIIYAVYHNTDGSIEYYISVKISEMVHFWGKYDYNDFTQYDLNQIVPTNWIILFLIPYVCFKYIVRDGSNGALYSEEFQQGFQQLQNSYDVPSKVMLSEVANLPAYKEDVKKHLPYLNVKVETKAITENMLHSRTVLPTYGGIFDNGGWGI